MMMLTQNSDVLARQFQVWPFADRLDMIDGEPGDDLVFL
jgi:hypothetical protein